MTQWMQQSSKVFCSAVQTHAFTQKKLESQVNPSRIGGRLMVGLSIPNRERKQPKTAQEVAAEGEKMFTPVDSSTWWMLLTFDNSRWHPPSPPPPNNLALHWLTTTFKPELLAAELLVLKSPVPCCQWYFCRVFQFSCLEPMLLFRIYFELLDKKQSSSIEPTHPLWKEDVHKQTD